MPSRFESSPRRSSIGQSHGDSSRPAAAREPATLPPWAVASSAVHCRIAVFGLSLALQLALDAVSDEFVAA
jgi:hypothetical protein